MDNNTADNSPICISHSLVSIKKFYDFRFFSFQICLYSCHTWADCTNTLFWYFGFCFSCFMYLGSYVIGVGHKFFSAIF